MELIKQEPVLCIDPGTTHSGVVVFNGQDVLYANSEYANNQLINSLPQGEEFGYISKMAIEGVQSYGMAVGKSTFETVEWIGRFRQEWGFDDTAKIYRSEVKLFLCQSMRAKDKNIRQRILDIFPAIGGGKTPQIGTNKQPGPLYGVTSHALSALAIGLTYFYSKPVNLNHVK